MLMEYLLFALLIALIVVVNKLPIECNSRRGFFWCRKCLPKRDTMEKAPLKEAPLPYEVILYLSKHRLPAHVVSRYVCRRGHTQIWFIPKLGKTDKSMFVVRDL